MDADQITAHKFPKVLDHEENVNVKGPCKFFSCLGRQLIKYPTHNVTTSFWIEVCTEGPRSFLTNDGGIEVIHTIPIMEAVYEYVITSVNKIPIHVSISDIKHLVTCILAISMSS